ncbi:MAG TPA: HNH endonuclease [Bacteroidia bacterium]|nr:HNH endonuclease [Bacteroidia bacterium]
MGENLLALFGLSLLALPSISLARTWTDDLGSHRIEAELSEILDDEVELKTDDGRLIVVPIEKLSADDRIFILSERIKRQVEREQAEKERRQTEELKHQAEEQQRQAEREQAEERRRQAEELKHQAEEQQRQAEREQAEERRRQAETQAEYEQVEEGRRQWDKERIRQAEEWEWKIILIIMFLVASIIWLIIPRKRRKSAFQLLSAQLLDDIIIEKQNLSKFIEEKFLVQPCSRCHEFSMRLLEISPNSRSVHYECTHCKRKARAASGSPEASQATEMWNRVENAVSRYIETTQLWDEALELLEPIEFLTAAAPLPYEQTERSPIPEAVRSEVWRRDKGCCVECGIKQNLQFDHIIPVSRGGATSVQNLQLLCRTCNQRKGAKI